MESEGQMPTEERITELNKRVTELENALGTADEWRAMQDKTREQLKMLTTAGNHAAKNFGTIKELALALSTDLQETKRVVLALLLMLGNLGDTDNKRSEAVESGRLFRWAFRKVATKIIGDHAMLIDVNFPDERPPQRRLDG